MSVSSHPIRLAVTDDLRRSRLTVFFRLLLALPHLVWLTVWGLVMVALAPVIWLIVVVLGRAPLPLHRFAAAFVRYGLQVSAYISLAANPFPGFVGAPGYPIDVTIDAPARQHRLGALFRFVLVLPALALASVLGGSTLFYSASGVVAICAVLAWFASLVLGRMPRGLRDLQAFSLGYGAQTTAYLLFVTGRYPSSDPGAMSLQLPPATHPVSLRVGESLERSRLTVLFRILLVLPHFIWLSLWSMIVMPVVVVGWLVTLVVGRLPRPLHRFIAAWLRYTAHVYAFLFVVGGPFPGFLGVAGSYPVDIEISAPERQARLRTLFRLPLALPALFVSAGLGYVLYTVGLLAWWYALVRGRVPVGLRNLGAVCIRYQAQVGAFVFLATERYPHAGPTPPGGDPDGGPEEPPVLVPVGAPPLGETGAEADPV